MNYSYITDFYKSREGRIGASDIPCLISHPDRPSESLAGYGQTALTLYEQKIGLTKRDPAGFAADMGHFLEPKALYEFIKDFANPVLGDSTADDFFRGYIHCELERVGRKNLDCRPFNNTLFKHHTEAMNEFGVSHADCLFVPDYAVIKTANVRHTACVLDAPDLYIGDPFIIEAKSAQYWVVKSRKKDKYSGYDLKLKEWQGIPLKHYLQIQYQMALYGVDTAFLSLIYNTSEKHYWKIKANPKHQAELLELAFYMKQCIDKRRPPKERAMNAADIRKLYPKIQEDFTELTEDELDHALEVVKKYRKAKKQIKIWKAVETDAENAMAVLLKGQREIKGVVEDELKTIARWKNTGGGDKIKALSKIKEDDALVFRYLKRKKMIEQKNTGEKPDIKLKLED